MPGTLFRRQGCCIGATTGSRPKPESEKIDRITIRQRCFYSHPYRAILTAHNRPCVSRFAAGNDRKPLFPFKTTAAVFLSKCAAFSTSNEGAKAVSTRCRQSVRATQQHRKRLLTILRHCWYCCASYRPLAREPHTRGGGSTHPLLSTQTGP